MQNIQTFDQCLSALMKKHHITISDLTRRLGIKSNTTVSRVLHTQCSAQAAERFFQILLNAAPTVFDTGEFRELTCALEVSRLGVDAYSANLEMWRLLSNETVPSTPFPIESYGGGRFANTTQLRAHYATVRNATIHIVCSLGYPLFSEMRDLLLDAAPSRNIQVHHYFSLEGDSSQIIRAMRTALPAVCLPCYRGYKMTRPQTLDKEFLSQSHAIARFQRADGSYGTHLIIFVANRCLLYENDEQSGLFDMFYRRIADQGRWYAPIKEDLASDFPVDLILSSKRMYLQEKDRALYGIKPDIPLSALPYELIEGIIRNGAGQMATTGAMLSELKWIQMQRNRNVFEKKSPSHFIVQREGLRRFAKTGVLSNQPRGVRAFTPEERMVILGDCLRRTQEMHYFKLHLARGRLAECAALEILCLDKLGVQFSSPWNSFRVEPVIVLSEFTELYQNFYMGELLGKYVEDDEVCYGFIQGLIDELKDTV